MKNNNRLYKTFSGQTIDLSRVISISDAYFYSEDNYSGYVGFKIYFDLTDKPIKYIREIWYSKKDERNSNDKGIDTPECFYEYCSGATYYQRHLKLSDGSTKTPNKIKEKHWPMLVCVQNLQKEVDEIILVWQEYLNQNKQ